MTFVTDGDTKLIAAIGQWSLHPNSSCLLCIRYVCEDLSVHGKRVLRAEALNMRLTEYVNTKWEEMIRDWRAVMYAKTEPDYAVAWSNFKPGSFVNISMNHELGFLGISRRLVTAWTRHSSLDNTVTSRTESLHSALKTVLRHSIRDPKDVVDAFSTVLKEQQCGYQHSVKNERTVTQHRHRGMLFALVNGFISQFTLDKVQKHMTLFN